MTKTRALYEARVEKYKENNAELAKVVAEIQRLGGSAELPSQPVTVAAATSGENAVIDVDGQSSEVPNRKASKKRRINAPIPADAEIVEID